MPAVAVAVLIAYDYDCARKLSATRPFGGEAGLAQIESHMMGQKGEKKAELRRCEARFADQSAAPKTSFQ